MRVMASSVFIMFLFAGAARSGEWESLTKEQRDRLLAGEVIYKSVIIENEQEKHKGHGVSMVLVNAPVEQCWKLFTQINSHHEFIPQQTGSAVVEQSPGHARVLKQFTFFGIKLHYTIIYTIDDKNHRIDFQLDPDRPHGIKDTSGYFLFEQVAPDTTLFVYGLKKLDPGIPVPQFAVDLLQKRTLPDVAENTKKRIESGGKWKKDERALYQGWKNKQEPQ